GDKWGAGDSVGASRQGALRRRAITIVTVISLLVGLTLYLTDALHETELDTIDTRFDVRGTQDPPDDLVVVNVDDRTFRELKLRWPFPRSEHAKLLDRLPPHQPPRGGLARPLTAPTIPP